MVLPQGASTLELAAHEVFLMAVPIETPDPEFPDRSRDARAGVDARLCATFIVTADGRTEEVRVVSDPLECPGALDPGHAVFADAVLDAVSGWSFFGAAICTPAPTAVQGDDCDGDGATLEPIAIRLMYVFSFIETDGRQTVSALRRD